MISTMTIKQGIHVSLVRASERVYSEMFMGVLHPIYFLFPL